MIVPVERFALEALDSLDIAVSLILETLPNRRAKNYYNQTEYNPLAH